MVDDGIFKKRPIIGVFVGSLREAVGTFRDMINLNVSEGDIYAPKAFMEEGREE